MIRGISNKLLHITFIKLNTIFKNRLRRSSLVNIIFEYKIEL